MMKNFLYASCFLLLTIFASLDAYAGSQRKIRIVGSSTVFPFATAIAEEFGALTSFPTPIIESTGSGGGIKLFCGGIGTQHPDIVNASRAMKNSEKQLCKSQGVTEISEVIIGYDGIVLASSKQGQKLHLTKKQLFLALAEKIPSNKDGSGELTYNYYKNWNEIDPGLPNIKIEILGPPPTSGTRDAFVELAMHAGCKNIAAYANMTKKERKTHCSLIREDGVYVDAGENDNLIIQKLMNNPKAYGIFGYSFLDRNLDKLNGSLIDNVEPSFENISSGDYPLSRPLFFYVKRQHIELTPGIVEYISEFFSDKASGEEGYLEERGLIALNGADRDRALEKAKNEGIIN